MMMGKTYKDRPDKYNKDKLKRKPREKRFVKSKGRKKENLKHNLDDYFI